MKTFAQVIDAGSFTEAARRMHLSKGLISKRIAQLEEHLGVQLLHRTNRQLIVTDSGVAFYDRCQKILQDVDDAEAEISEMDVGLRGHLRVSSPTSFAVSYLGADLCEFQHQHPDLTIELNHHDRAVNPVAEDYDVCIQVMPVRGEAISEKPISPARRVVVASPQYLARYGTPRHPGELETHQCAHNPYLEAGMRWDFHGPDGATSVHVQPIVMSNNIWLLRDAAVHNNCVAVLPTFFIANDLIDGSLVQILPDYSPKVLELVAYYQRLRHTPTKTRRLLQFLKSKYGPTPPWEQLLSKEIGSSKT